jgi:hypothetical protein
VAPALAVSAANPSVISTLRAGCHLYLAPTLRRRMTTGETQNVERAGHVAAGTRCRNRALANATIEPAEAGTAEPLKK